MVHGIYRVGIRVRVRVRAWVRMKTGVNMTSLSSASKARLRARVRVNFTLSKVFVKYGIMVRVWGLARSVIMSWNACGSRKRRFVHA